MFTMKKQLAMFVTLSVMLIAFMVTLGGCSGSDSTPETTETLSGTYVSVEDSTKHLEFSGTKVTLYEDGNQVRSGDYRFQGGALIISYNDFSERYTLDESRDTLFQGNSNRDDYGEVAFTKGATQTGSNVSPSPAVTEVPTEAPVSLSLTGFEARDLLQSWLNDNPFPMDGSLDEYWYDVEDGYIFTLYHGTEMLTEVIVNKDTGELLYPEPGEAGVTMFPLDDWYADWSEWYVEHGGYGYGEVEFAEASGFRRSDYFTGITRENLVRNPDNYSYSKVYFQRYTIHEIVEPKLYNAYQGSSFNAETVITIDDRGNIGSNAMKGDIVTVYGTFWRNNTLTLTTTNSNGQQSQQNIQVPFIGVDRLIFNSVNEPDPVEFAETYVEFLNLSSRAFMRDNRYISGTKVTLICKVYDYNRVTSFGPFEYSYMSGFFVDGYDASNFIIFYEGVQNRIPGAMEFEKLYAVTGDLKLHWVSGMSAIHFYIDSFEPYD
jgi:hypothetical protein